jgi:hypothetical protein
MEDGTGSSRVITLVERLLEAKARGDGRPGHAEGPDHDLLQWLADYFGMKKTAFANALFARAMEDAMARIALLEGREYEDSLKEVYLRRGDTGDDERGWVTEDGGETWTRA